ncbi:hypothetical protein G9A89_001833 [Geosiphon pyriformis]|nr:hypothetical protein G9A89_001833 [Geosiphon pyriformis]
MRISLGVYDWKLLIPGVVLIILTTVAGMKQENNVGKETYWCYSGAEETLVNLMNCVLLGLHLVAISWIGFCYQRTLHSVSSVQKAQISIQNEKWENGPAILMYGKVRSNRAQIVINRKIFSYCLAYGYQLISGFTFIFMQVIKRNEYLSVHILFAISSNISGF